MATYHVVRWRGIPSLVEARDGERTVRVPLSQRFQDLIDSVAMRQGATDGEAYLEAWGRGDEVERPGDAEPVARAVAVEIEAEFGRFVERHLGGR